MKSLFKIILVTFLIISCNEKDDSADSGDDDGGSFLPAVTISCANITPCSNGAADDGGGVNNPARIKVGVLNVDCTTFMNSPSGAGMYHIFGYSDVTCDGGRCYNSGSFTYYTESNPNTATDSIPGVVTTASIHVFIDANGDDASTAGEAYRCLDDQNLDGIVQFSVSSWALYP